MPPRKTLDDYINNEFDPSDLAAIYNVCRLKCEVKFKNACHASGIAIKGGVMLQQTILDVCRGPRMFWFNKLDTRAVFADT